MQTYEPLSGREPFATDERRPLLGGHGDDDQAEHSHISSDAPSVPVICCLLRWVQRQIGSPNPNVLLGFVPLGFLSAYLGWHPVLISAFNFLAILPLSALVSDASDQLADAWGDLVGVLLNATFGNAVELIVSMSRLGILPCWSRVGILAVQHHEIIIAQSMMLGSILSDILFILGACPISSAGLRKTKRFKEAVVDTMSSLMTITAVALILPTVLYASFSDTRNIGEKILLFSRATAGVLIVVYCVFIYFQMGTHKEIFEGAAEQGDDSDERATIDWPSEQSSVFAADPSIVENRGGNGTYTSFSLPSDVESQQLLATRSDDAEPGSPDGHFPRQDIKLAAVLLVCGAIIMLCTHQLIENLDETAKFLNITKTFVATILFPIVSNASEGTQVLIASRSRKIDHAIGVIVSSILQIALFVLPVLVVVGWVIHSPMTLFFDSSAVCILFLSVLMVNQVLQEGTYTYLHGVMLLSLYAIIALTYFIQTDH